MSEKDPGFDHRVLAVLERTRDLPSVPAIAVEVLRIAQDEEASADDLASVLSLDPALAARILKVSNSALFGRRTEISTLQRACTQLGFKTVKLWSLSFTMVDSLDRPEVEGFDFEEYWKRSVVRAVAAKLVAAALIPKLVDEAFIAGLLSRIGQLVLARCLPGEYKAVLAVSSESWPSQELQKETLGFSSDDLGAALLHSWKLPSLIYEAVRWAPNIPEADEDLPETTRQLAQCLRVASRCEDLVCGPSKAKALVRLREAAKEHFSLEPEEVEDLLAKVDQGTIEIAAMLQIKITSGPDMAEILRSAQLELLRETISLLHKAVVNEQRAAQLEFENSLLLLKAETDPLTGLADRATFQEALETYAAPESDPSYRLRTGLLKVVVDNFEDLINEHGTEAGDRVLQLVAKVIRAVSGESDLAARYGEGEFAVVTPRTSVVELPEMAERIRSGIQKQRVATDLGKIPVTVSIGGVHTEVLESPISAEELIELAGRHTDRAREGGGNQCSFAVGSLV